MEKFKGINLFWYFSQFGIKNLIPLLALPIFTRHISVEDFGIYALAFFYASIVTGISNLGLLSIFERNFFELSQNRRKSLLFSNITFVSLVLIFFYHLTYQFKGVISEYIFQKNDLKNYLILALWHQGFKSLNLYFLSYFKNFDNAKTHTLLAIGESLLSISLALFLVLKYTMGLYGFFLGQCIGTSIIFTITFIYLFFPFNYKIDTKLLHNQLKLSFPLTPRIFFGVINNQFDRYMIGILSTIGGVGIYDIGQKIATTSFVFMTSLENAYSPEVYRRLFSKDKIVYESVGSFLMPFFYLSIFICLMVGLFSYEILFILTAREFHDASPIITILCLLYGFYFFGKQPQLLYAKKTGLISFLSIVSILLNIAFNIPMINHFGIIGAAWATLFAGIFSTIISFYFGQKYTYINYDKKCFNFLIYFIFSLFTIILIDFFNLEYIIILNLKFLLAFGFLFYGIKLKIISKRLFILY